MLRTLWGVALIGLVIVSAGCGGGGGAAGVAPTQELAMLPLEMTGDYAVRSLGLPGDRMSVEPDGQVVVSSSALRSTVAIGTCSPGGRVTLNGGWQADGQDYSIVGSGSISPTGGSVTLRATVTAGSTPVVEDAQVSGVRLSADGLDVPPPPPISEDEGDGGWELPPPPPMDDETAVQSDGADELPPPPPAFD